MVANVFTRVLCRFPRGCIFTSIHSAAWRMGKNHIPERWTEYIPVGKRIPGTRFVAFKVPLKKFYENKLAPNERFSPSDLVQEITKQNEELGMIVDLTCTWRYYTPEELPKSVRYAKLFTAGQEIPNENVVKQFKCIIERFLKDNSENDKLIGVHCTHGLNRTGFLVCRYLIDVLGMVPADAIEHFNRSRGHFMERKNYLDALMRRQIISNNELNKPKVPVARPKQHIRKKNQVCNPAPYGNNHLTHSSVHHRPHSEPPMHHVPRTQVPQMSTGDPHTQSSKRYRRHRKKCKRKHVTPAQDTAQNQSVHTHPYKRTSTLKCTQRPTK